MDLKQYHLSYCTNIHAGESWEAAFESLKNYVPDIKAATAPNQPFGIGLRLSDQASKSLSDPVALQEFKNFLKESDCYVFTMNGFPFGNFHRTVVKDAVHLPDWSRQERLDYTLRLFNILKELLPPDTEGGISTSPLSYRLWFVNQPEKLETVYQASIQNLAKVVIELFKIKRDSGIFMHLDLEPEPDGLMDCTADVLDFYQNKLIPIAGPLIAQELDISLQQAKDAILDHLQICYDVCHFAVMFEASEMAIQQITDAGIKIGKVQISAALKAHFSNKEVEDQKMRQILMPYAESTYLHQVIIQDENQKLTRYNDLSTALSHHQTVAPEEWRTHFHVPIFLENFGHLVATQSDIVDLLAVLKQNPFTQHLEVETYTWEVLPEEIKTDLKTSIIRELDWVLAQIN